MGWVANATPRLLYPQERSGTHFIEGWVGLRAGLDRCGKSSPHREVLSYKRNYLYYYYYYYYFRAAQLI